MAIKINDIPPEGLTLEYSQGIDLFDEGNASTRFSATLTIKPAGGGTLRVTGSVQADTSLECSRCLKRFPFRVQESRLDVELMPGTSRAGTGEHELDRSELDVEFYQGDEIEPLELIKEQLLLGVPMVPVHSEECKGLCTVCGADLNEKECGCHRATNGNAGPFSALKDLLNRKKE